MTEIHYQGFMSLYESKILPSRNGNTVSGEQNLASMSADCELVLSKDGPRPPFPASNSDSCFAAFATGVRRLKTRQKSSQQVLLLAKTLCFELAYAPL